MGFDFESKDSSFNEAVLKLARINQMQDILNVTRHLIWNRVMDGGHKKWGFEIIISCLEGLFMEVSGKLTEAKDGTEKEDDKSEMGKAMKIRNECWKAYNAINGIQPQLWGKNQDKINALSKAFFDFELFLRQMLEVHNMSIPNKANMGRAILG
jgi:hypothetical protein